MANTLIRRAGRLLIGILLPIFAIAIVVPNVAHAAAFSITITIDENGNGQLTNTNGFNQPLPFALQNDPGPGGLPNALTYALFNPPGLVSGDLVLTEGVGGPISDVLRFNSNESCSGTTGCLVFYSDIDDGADALADIGFPTSSYTNVVTFAELGVEGNNGFIYTPTAGQPGFVAGAGGSVTYNIKSDIPSDVPEPASLMLLGAGISGVFLVSRKRRIETAS